MSDKLILSIIRGLVSFVLSITITVSFIAFWASATILNYSKVDKFLKDDFYGMLYEEVCDNIIENTVSTGLPEEILLVPLSEEIIANEMDASLESLYAGKQYSLNAVYLEEEYKNTISEYVQAQNLELDEEATDELVRYIIRLIEDSVHIPFANTLLPYFSMIKEYIGYIAVGLLAVSIVLALFLFFLCRPRYVSLRYYGRSLMSFGVLGAFVSVYVTAKNLTGSVNIASPAYSEAIKSISQGTFNSLLIIAITAFAIGLAMSFVPSSDNSETEESDKTENASESKSKDTVKEQNDND